MNIQDAIDVIESVAGFTDESTPVGEAWLEVLLFIHHPTALAQPEPVAPTDEELTDMAEFYIEDNGLLGLHNAGEFARSVLARWGTPTIQPVPAAWRPLKVAIETTYGDAKPVPLFTAEEVARIVAPISPAEEDTLI